MRYAKIETFEICNGSNIGCSLYTQGCRFGCSECFNPETWSFSGGKEWTEEIEEKFFELINRPYIKRISILGGEPLTEENLDDLLKLITRIHEKVDSSKKIWIYTGYCWEYVFDDKWHYHPQTVEKLSTGRWRRQKIISQCDVIVDGQFEKNLKDPSLIFKGSSNQRVIDVQGSLRKGEIVLWDTN